MTNTVTPEEEEIIKYIYILFSGWKRKGKRREEILSRVGRKHGHRLTGGG